mmetsp:Transcript_35824/g.110919  ORF Transcript_35824/g.110919 Transcript_35824/m.110919 type:complete len:140 (+) Transcript_35824:150-569(+)
MEESSLLGAERGAAAAGAGAPTVARPTWLVFLLGALAGGFVVGAAGLAFVGAPGQLEDGVPRQASLFNFPNIFSGASCDCPDCPACHCPVKLFHGDCVKRSNWDEPHSGKGEKTTCFGDGLELCNPCSYPDVFKRRQES